MTTAVELNAHYGALLLDQKRPTWFLDVDMKSLDIWSPDTCVLKQVYGDYLVGLELVFEMFEGRITASQCIGYGFDVDLQDKNFDTPGLNQAWRNEIGARRVAYVLRDQPTQKDVVLVGA